ncbi:GAF domain-containing protein [Amycolatopsis arida]|uniref:GAF domain-containing protein n=1 Tax=Amycolatopsis arida TaxID=587909 RepID=A0A1I5PT23_9PSEU|nr:GAF and ANTAR domain-containing protein [Amycolatopsis arida]TDX98595.1 GAF domain-containing protein [Amycolatopsis arida]SFP37185.1 GAF domain-containing protein [Amycolatopsis arida]
MSGSVDWEELATALARMARDLLAQDSVQKTLDRIVTHAVGLVEGCEFAGILVVRKKDWSTLAATDNVVHASDRAQVELHEGPCFDATVNRHELYRIGDMTSSEQRWPRYAPRAHALGIGSMMGFLLFTNGTDNLGALNMYSSRPNAFTDRSERPGWILAAHAAVALSSARTDANLHDALATRTDIGEALGIMMERYKIDEHAAFDLLRRISQHHNTKIRDLARGITTTGYIPHIDNQ